MIHLYYGDGKGKSTAACGLAVRAAGSGMRVLFVQFFKAGTSGEFAVLRKVESMDFIFPDSHFGRYHQMNEAQRETVKAAYARMLGNVISRAKDYDLIVLDEVVSAFRYEMINQKQLLAFLKKEGQHREIVLTGRQPLSALSDLADYATEMKQVKHPFERGILARKGIEY